MNEQDLFKKVLEDLQIVDNWFLLPDKNSPAIMASYVIRHKIKKYSIYIPVLGQCITVNNYLFGSDMPETNILLKRAFEVWGELIHTGHIKTIQKNLDDALNLVIAR